MTPQPDNSHTRSPQPSTTTSSGAHHAKGFYGVLTQLVRQQKRQRSHGRG